MRPRVRSQVGGFSKLPASILVLLLLLPQFVRAETQATSAESDLDQIASNLARQMTAQRLQVVVMDFSAPNDRALPFGAYLADEFSAALAKQGGLVSVIDRKQVQQAFDAMHLPPEKQFDDSVAITLAKKIGANCFVRGSYAEFKGALGITVSAELIPEAILHSHSSSAGLANGKISMSSEMASHLDQPLESLRTVGSVTPSGHAGMTYPKCIKCPPAKYSDAAVKAKYEGTVVLSVVVTPGGRATDFKILRGLGMGLDEKAVEAVEKWKFSPALDPDGNPGAVLQTIEITFQLYRH